MAWLISLFTGSASGYLISAGVGALLAGAVCGYSIHTIDGVALAKSQSETAKVNSDYSLYKASVAASAAKADADALAQKQAQDTTANALQDKLIEAQKEANAKSDALKAILDRAAPQDQRQLGPSSLAYLDSLRAQASPGRSATPGQ